MGFLAAFLVNTLLVEGGVKEGMKNSAELGSSSSS